MNGKNSNFVPLKNVKVEENVSDFDSNIGCFTGDEKSFVGKNENKCKNKCFDIVDKWIARVVVKVPTGNNWHNIVAREIAILKVRYPFLTEQQLKGKALMKFGIPSMCGNVIRTGAGKVTGIIAKELSQKSDRKTRIPSAFKVLKHFLPCMNKFEAKYETNIWTQEPLYNRKNTAFTAKMIPLQNFKPEKIKSKYLPPLNMHSIVINPLSRSMHLSPKINLSDSALEQINCTMLTPTKKKLLQPQRKSLLSQFNDTDDTKISMNNNEIKELHMKIKHEMDLPENIECIRMIGNNSNRNIYDDIQNEVCNKKKPMQRIQTYSEMSEESIDIVKRLHCVSNEEELPKNNGNNGEKVMKVHCVDQPRTIVDEMEIDSQDEEYELNDSNCSYGKQLLSKSHANRYATENYITKHEYKSAFRSMSILNYSPLSCAAVNVNPGVKRHQYDPIDVLSSPKKISRRNSDRHFQGISSSYSNYDQIHDFYNSQTISNSSIIEESFQQSIVQTTTIFNNSRVDSFFEPTPLDEKLNSIEEYNNNNFGIPMSNIQFPSLATTRCGSILNPWDTIENKDLDCKTVEEIDGSRTTCTLTPNIHEILPEIDVLEPSYFEVVSTQTSVDLLARDNAITPFYFDTHSNVQPHCKNSSSEECMQYEKQKSSMLSNFCSEYDRGWTRLIRKKRHFMNKTNTSTNIMVSMEAIKVEIQKAIEILDGHFNNNE